MNKIKFQYVVGDKKFLVSLDEHFVIVKSATNDTKIVKLRGGLVQFNLAYFQYSEVLEESIEEEAKARLLAQGSGVLEIDVRRECYKIYEELAAQFNTDVKYLS